MRWRENWFREENQVELLEYVLDTLCGYSRLLCIICFLFLTRIQIYHNCFARVCFTMCPRLLVQHQYNSVELAMKGWLGWSCCSRAPSQRGSFGAAAALRHWWALDVWDIYWESGGSCASGHVSTSCCADRLMLAVQKAQIKPSGESEQECMSQELGGEGSCWCEERWGCGEGWEWNRLCFCCGRYPVVTVIWQSERNRAGGQVLVCLFTLGWGKYRQREEVEARTLRWCSSGWEISQEKLLGGHGDDLSVFIFLLFISWLSAAVGDWHLQAERMERKCVIGACFLGIRKTLVISKSSSSHKWI